MLDLEGLWNDLGISAEIQDQLTIEIADTDASGKTLANKIFHSCPGLLDGSVALDKFVAFVKESWWVSYRRVDVFESYWEVNNEEVKLLDTPILKLLSANWLNLVAIVEGIPEFRNDEEILAFYQTILDGTSNTLTGFDFVSVICFASVPCHDHSLSWPSLPHCLS
jgi:hypothetical protein